MFLNLIERVSAAIPSQCAVCRSWPSHRLCDDCISEFAAPSSRCRTCALPLPPLTTPSVIAGICYDCVANPSPLHACYAALPYRFPWISAISRLKFGGDTGWASAFASLMINTPQVQDAIDDADMLIPIPLSFERLAERGFNQANEIARHLCASKTQNSLLLRTNQSSRQSDSNRVSRMDNMKHAFAVDPLRSAKIAGKKIVLVDDVMTTGATIFSAAKTLKQAGAAEVVAIVAARTDAPGQD